jgi:hypothetical protein
VRANTFHEFRPTAASPVAVASTTVVSAATVVSICDSPLFCRTMKEQSQEANRDGLGALRGFRYALFLEGGMGLLVYGIWQLAHLAR